MQEEKEDDCLHSGARQSARSQIRPEQRTIRGFCVDKDSRVNLALKRVSPPLKARMQLRMPIFHERVDAVPNPDKSRRQHCSVHSPHANHGCEPNRHRMRGPAVLPGKKSKSPQGVSARGQAGLAINKSPTTKAPLPLPQRRRLPFARALPPSLSRSPPRALPRSLSSTHKHTRSFLLSVALSFYLAHKYTGHTHTHFLSHTHAHTHFLAHSDTHTHIYNFCV